MKLWGAKLHDGLSQNVLTALKFIDGDEFAGAVRFTDVAGPNHDRFTAQHHHLRGFSAKRDCSRLVAAGIFEELDQW